MIIAGIDYSLGCPAICVQGKDDDLFIDYQGYFVYNAKYRKTHRHGKFLIIGTVQRDYACEEERYDWLADWATSILEVHNVTDVYLEDYSYGSKGKVFHIGENTGILKHYLWKYAREDYSNGKPNRIAGLKVHLVAPTAAKKFATGKGNASKWDMHDQFVKDTGIDLSKEMIPDKENASSPVNDFVDAYFILKYGEHDQLERK